ncbi:MAG: sulfotransferase [Halioglobus sp.]|nr:sulfotransferase [Halioglobus sp.]
MPSYLFILCPPYSGSTLLWNLISTSANVSSLPLEGQFLPELEALMREKPWDAKHVLPWAQIKTVWESYWNKDKPVLLEKSPPNIIRTRDILANFEPVKFLIMVRNPYAHSEGLMRRNNMSVERAANFSMMCLRTQLNNACELDNALVLTYESLVLNPVKVRQKIADFIPSLNDMNFEASFKLDSVEGTLTRPITDLNTQKIASLSADTIAAMNDVFSQHQKTVEAWGYELLTPAF